MRKRIIKMIEKWKVTFLTRRFGDETIKVVLND